MYSPINVVSTQLYVLYLPIYTIFMIIPDYIVIESIGKMMLIGTVMVLHCSIQKGLWTDQLVGGFGTNDDHNRVFYHAESNMVIKIV